MKNDKGINLTGKVIRDTQVETSRFPGKTIYPYGFSVPSTCVPKLNKIVWSKRDYKGAKESEVLIF